MTTNSFESQEINLQIQPMPTYVDTDGSFKINTPMLSTYNFDGVIPKYDGLTNVENVKPGYLIQIESGGQYYPIVSVESDEPDFDDTNIITINYVNDLGNIDSKDYDEGDEVNVIYENWDEKIIGSQGWGITSGGNAIFTNVAVRGDLEATTLDVGGDLGITFDGTTVTLGASVVINAPVTFNGSGSFVTFNNLSASYALQSFVDTINNRLSASIGTLNINANSLTASMNFLYNAGFVTDSDLVTTGNTVINGNNITTGIINANLVKVESSPLTASAGFKINSLGIYAYNQSNQETFRVESTTGNVFIRGGTLTIGAGSSIDGYATDGELSNGLAGKIDDGQAAADIVTSQTTITGGNIATGSIKSGGYSGPGTGSAFSTTGMLINLDFGTIASKNFRVDNSGNAFFQGDITAKSGYFGNPNYGMSIVDDGSTVTIRTTTLRMGSTINSSILHGSIDFYTTSGATIGQISSAQSNKTWSGLGEGIVLGTTSDYFFLPRSTNTTTKSRYLGSGFEWYGQSGVRLMSIGGGTGGLRIENNTGGIQVSGGGDIRVSDGGRFVGDGSGLTNLPGGGGGGVTSFKWGDNGITETGAVSITGAEIITGINAGSIGNGKLANSTIQIMSTTKSLGQAFVAGDIDGDVLTANSVPPGKISNSGNLFSIGSTGVSRGNSVSTIVGPLTIGAPATGNALTVNGGLNNGLQVPTARGLNYVMNFGTSTVNLNRASQAITLSGVTVDGLSTGTSLFTLGTTAITAGNTFSTISGGLTLNGGPTLGGGPTLQTGTNGFVTVTIGSGGTFRVNTLPLNLSGATSFVRYNPTTGALAYTTTTSALKYKNITEENVDLSDDSWINDINIVKFKYKLEEEEFSEDAPTRIGLIADEISTFPIFDEIVERDSVTGEVDSIQYDKLALYLIPIIKELKNKINNLEERLDAAGI